MKTLVTERALTREQLAHRVALELQDGWHVNLGIGLPTLVANYISADREVILHSENGILGMGPRPPTGEEDPDLVDAGKNPVTLRPGGSYFHHADSFAMIRGGHLDAAVLGGMQVAKNGDLANWIVGGRKLGSIGGAMDLCCGAKRVFVAMEHCTKDGEPKLLHRCTYPLTARRVVTLVFTDLAVVEVTAEGFVLREVAPGLGPADVQAVTEAQLKISPDLSSIRV